MNIELTVLTNFTSPPVRIGSDNTHFRETNVHCTKVILLKKQHVGRSTSPGVFLWLAVILYSLLQAPTVHAISISLRI